MTSSLVGSEMCIRDRNKGKRRKGWKYRGTSSGQPGVLYAQQVQGGLSDCLLYTSDAADDM
eukprot:3868319-Prorocentrum_lima.AAC.1